MQTPSGRRPFAMHPRAGILIQGAFRRRPGFGGQPAKHEHFAALVAEVQPSQPLFDQDARLWRLGDRWRVLQAASRYPRTPRRQKKTPPNPPLLIHIERN
jgi:hypothetical protein